jgi:CheY-like chemotaxis protein
VTIRVLLVDDHPPFRRLARVLLERGGFNVVGEVATGQGALRAVEIVRPQLVLLDVMLPDLDGVAVAQILAASPERPMVILVSARPLTDFDDRLISTATAGFIAKDDLTAEWITALIGH